MKYSFCTSMTSRARFITPPFVEDGLPAIVRRGIGRHGLGKRAGRPVPTWGSSHAVRSLSSRHHFSQNVLTTGVFPSAIRRAIVCAW